MKKRMRRKKFKHLKSVDADAHGVARGFVEVLLHDSHLLQHALYHLLLVRQQLRRKLLVQPSLSVFAPWQLVAFMKQ